MKNGLLRKVGIGVILPLAFTVFSCGKTYQIDNSLVKKTNPGFFKKIVESKGDSLEIKYSVFWGLSEENLHKLKINGIKYKKKDSLVYEVGNKRYHYLCEEIDSIKHTRRELKIQAKKKKKQLRKQEKINYGLKALE